MAPDRRNLLARRQIPEDALFRVVANTASDGIITIDRHSTILFANEAVEQIFGYPRSELLGGQLTSLMPDYLRHLHEAAIERYLETGERHLHWGGIELPGLHADGREIPLEVSFGETVEEGERLFTGVIRDISERKRLERRWDAQYAIAQTLAAADDLETAATGILQAMCECLDWQVGAMWRPDDAGYLRYFVSWTAQEVDAAAFVAASEGTTFEPGVGLPGRVLERGEPLWIEDVQADGNFPRVRLAMAAGLHAAFAFPILDDDRAIGVMEFYSDEIREPDTMLLNMVRSTAAQIGQFVRRQHAEGEIRLLNRDLEERVLERTAQLEASNAELESFVYSVSHDLRSPLRGIDGFSGLLLEDYASVLDDAAAGYLERIRRAAGRMGELIDALLDLSRLSQLEPNRVAGVDLTRMASEVVDDLRRREPERSVDFLVQPDTTAYGDPNLLRIILANLLENSWKFTRNTQRPRIEFGTETGAETVYFVRDNGAGFDMAYAKKLFDPFQRLHSPDQFEGTGIGLATVARIVHKHGGRVWAESRVDGGATFRFTLPRWRTEESYPGGEPAPESSDGTGTTAS